MNIIAVTDVCPHLWGIINIDKGKQRIASGIASFELSGNFNGENDFSYTGDIIFLGDDAANVIINGNTYTIDLY
ncbi:MAG: hypothetical protein AAGJ93_16545 [Bacteroidota bacterium]